jgi:hypothetical protein
MRTSDSIMTRREVGAAKRPEVNLTLGIVAQARLPPDPKHQRQNQRDTDCHGKTCHQRMAFASAALATATRK